MKIAPAGLQLRHGIFSRGTHSEVCVPLGAHDGLEYLLCLCHVFLSKWRIWKLPALLKFVFFDLFACPRHKASGWRKWPCHAPIPRDLIDIESIAPGRVGVNSL